MVSKHQMSESWLVGLLLACGGGFLDSYSYLVRDGKFATMQTGNMILFAVNLASNKVIPALYYLIPIFSFFIGCLLASL